MCVCVCVCVCETYFVLLGYCGHGNVIEKVSVATYFIAGGWVLMNKLQVGL